MTILIQAWRADDKNLKETEYIHDQHIVMANENTLFTIAKNMFQAGLNVQITRSPAHVVISADKGHFTHS